MDNSIKAIFFDFDGTVYSHTTESVPESTIKAFKLLRDKGILTFLATGRSKPEMTWFDTSDLIFSGQILNNGQLAIDENNNYLYKDIITGELKENILKVFNEKKIPMYLISENDIFCNFVNDEMRIAQEKNSSPIPRVKEYEGEDIYMTSIVYKTEEEKEQLYSIGGNVMIWQNNAIDIVPLTASKSKGIIEVCKKYQIDIKDTMAFGDGLNDIDMIQTCGIGVAMGNSKNEVKQAADYVTEDIDEDGLYNALKHFKLI